MSQSNFYDAVVVGAGVEGSSTAMWLARKGVKTLLLDQFELGHTRGSSHGGSRIIRYNLTKDVDIEMMKTAYTMWADIEKEAGVKLVEKCGGIAFGKYDQSVLINTIPPLKRARIPHEVLGAKDIANRFPFLEKIPTDSIAVYEPDAGILHARKCLLAMQKLFLSHGGTILDRYKVVGITPGERIEVNCENGTFYCNSLVVCAGTWANKVLAYTNLKLAVMPERICVSYWEKTDPISNKIPVFFSYGEEQQFFGMPDCEYPGLFKICTHGGTPVDPDHRDKEPDNSKLKFTTEFIRSMIRGVSTKPSILETCMYTVTPDTSPFLDRHPQYSNIVIGAGFSGHGFKLSPVVGSILSGLVLGEDIPFDISHFKIARFERKSKL